MEHYSAQDWRDEAERSRQAAKRPSKSQINIDNLIYTAKYCDLRAQGYSHDEATKRLSS
jgi:hypothetical protein